MGYARIVHRCKHAFVAVLTEEPVCPYFPSHRRPPFKKFHGARRPSGGLPRWLGCPSHLGCWRTQAWRATRTEFLGHHCRGPRPHLRCPRGARTPSPASRPHLPHPLPSRVHGRERRPCPRLLCLSPETPRAHLTHLSLRAALSHHSPPVPGPHVAELPPSGWHSSLRESSSPCFFCVWRVCPKGEMCPQCLCCLVLSQNKG